MLRTVTPCLLALLSIYAFAKASDPATSYSGESSAYRIESTDWFLNRLLEERLVAQPHLFLYANILPRLDSPINDEAAAGKPIDLILQRRIQAYDDQTEFQLNKWSLYRSKSRGSLHFMTRFTPYVQEIATSDTMPVHRIGLTSEGWIIPLAQTQIHFRFRLENHGELYSQFNGRKWDEKITGWIDNAAIYYYDRGLFGSIGRSSVIWGPEQNDALLLSDNAPQLDRIWLGYEHRFVRFDYLLSRLDNFVQNDSILVRYISAHRLSFRKSGLFEIGLSELVLYGGHNRPIDWRYLNPFVPYYWEQWNRGSDDNIFFGLDFSLYWPRGTRIFGEFMVDDFQIDFHSEPHQVGYKLGFDMIEPFGINRTFTKLSYTRVNTTVYGQNQLQNLYIYYGEPIGYFGGNDQDRLLAQLRYHLSSALDLELEFQFNRRGEGRIEQHDRTGVPYETKFPTGIVEESPSLKSSIYWFHHGLFHGRLSGQYTHYQNFRNVCGDSEHTFAIDFVLSCFLQGIID